MAQTVKVVYSDGRAEEVTITPAAEIAFERQYDRSITKLSERNEFFYFLTWKCLELEGKETRTFDDFVKVLVSADFEAVKVPPTPRSPRTGVSSA